MKKILFLAAVAAMVSLTSCQKDDFNAAIYEQTYDGLVFTASLESSGTRTTITDEGTAGYKICWEATDTISINGVKFVPSIDKNNHALAIFTKASNETKADPTAPYTAYYPASIYDGTATTLPATQVYKADGNIAGILPMYAQSSDLELDFKNLCGLLKFTLKGTEKVHHITITDDTKALSGKFTVSGDAAVLDPAAKGGVTLDCGSKGVQLDATTGKTFYVAVPAGSYEKLRIQYNTVNFVKVANKKANATANVERNKVYPFTQTPTFRPDWFYFEAVNAGAKVALVKPAKKEANPPTVSLSYSIDEGKSWTNYTIAEEVPSSGLTAGQRIYFKAKTTNTAFAAVGAYDYNNFTATDSVKVGGNIMYLLNGSDPAAATISSYCFKGLFKENYCLVSASDLKLPAAKLSDNCYRFMFISCKSMKTAPALPATELADTCYYQMFTSCSALEAAPALPATKMKALCYSVMFQGCKTLVSGPVLPATELASSCYNQMFKECSKLVTAPALPATVLATKCYFKMFCDCLALENPPALPATTLADQCYDQTFTSCSTMVAAPILHAKVLRKGCYNGIFSKCVKLSSVTMLATDISAENCLNNWLGFGAGSQATKRTVYVASGMVDAVKAKVPSSPDWQTGVQVKP